VTVCFPRGFRAAGVECGIKDSGGLDLALVVSDVPASAAGVFTRNRFSAAPVRLTQRHVADGAAQAIVTNAGNANACTGEQGEADAAEMSALAAAALGLEPGDVLVASTGVIGKPLPMPGIRSGIASAAAALSYDGGEDAADAIRTTDAFAKLATREVALAGGSVRIGAMAKGAGMIRPDMATTLCQVTTDARVAPGLLRDVLRGAADRSFNLVSVDGTTSTNDCILLLANGAAGVALEQVDADSFGDALADVLLRLARMLVTDGEGASRHARYLVTGAADAAEARRAARVVGEDVLVRCALHGADPNWGRLLAALGGCGVEVDPLRVAVWYGDVQLVEAGAGLPERRALAKVALAVDAPEVRIDLGLGTGQGEVYASSLSPEYVEFNAEYTT
jgi:glutamate N-acetyltransferase/amino-acid N-acetyltransferase